MAVDRCLALVEGDPLSTKDPALFQSERLQLLVNLPQPKEVCRFVVCVAEPAFEEIRPAPKISHVDPKHLPVSSIYDVKIDSDMRRKQRTKTGVVITAANMG